jgi:hypothetical protein
MREIAPEVERDRDHLHSNPVQVLVATGWLGLAVYLAWMTHAVVSSIRFTRLSRDGPPAERSAALILLLSLLGLLANGLVEYNLGDGEILIVYGFLLGCTSAGLARRRA